MPPPGTRSGSLRCILTRGSVPGRSSHPVLGRGRPWPTDHVVVAVRPRDYRVPSICAKISCPQPGRGGYWHLARALVYKENEPRDGCSTIPGLALTHVRAKAGCPPSFRPRRDPPPVSGEGVLVRYSNCSQAQRKGQSHSITENSSDAPPIRRFGPLASADRARRLAELRTALADAAPTFQARLRAGEQGLSLIHI